MTKMKRTTRVAQLIMAHWLVTVIVLLAAFPQRAMAQTPARGDQDCEQLKEDIKTLQEELVSEVASVTNLQQSFATTDRKLQTFDDKFKVYLNNTSINPAFGEDERAKILEARRQIVLHRSKLKNQLEEAKLTIQALKDTLADLLNKLGDCGSKKSEPKPSPSPISGTTKGAIDSCLVGTWRSESIVSEVGYKGGAGIVLTIKPDGLETIDYNGMKPIEGNGETHLWRGVVEAYFTTSNGTATVTKAGKTDLTVKETYRDGHTTEKNTKALGLAALGNYSTDRSYTCDGTTLIFKSPLHTATFKREKK